MRNLTISLILGLGMLFCLYLILFVAASFVSWQILEIPQEVITAPSALRMSLLAWAVFTWVAYVIIQTET